MHPDACPLCGAVTLEALGSKTVRDTTYPLARCTACQLVFVTQLPSPDALAAYYAQVWAAAQSPERAAEQVIDRGIEAERFRRRLRELGRLAGAPGRLLDVGCRDGAFLTLARDAGWSVAGVELAAEAAQRAHARGLEVSVGTLETAPYPPSSFDVITLWHILEHVPDTCRLLQHVARLLKPRGWLAIETPHVAGRGFRRHSLQWEYLTPPDHLRYFSVPSLRHALEATGYDLCQQRFEGGTGLGPQASRLGLDGVRRWALAHYRWLWPLKRAYLAVGGALAPGNDILIAYARKR